MRVDLNTTGVSCSYASGHYLVSYDARLLVADPASSLPSPPKPHLVLLRICSTSTALLAIHSAQFFLENRHFLYGGFDHQAQLMQFLPVSLIVCVTSRNSRHDAECGAIIVVTLLR